MTEKKAGEETPSGGSRRPSAKTTKRGAKAKKADLWSYLKAHTSPAVFHSIRYGFGGVTNLNFPKGDTIVIGCYRIAQKLFKFN